MLYERAFEYIKDIDLHDKYHIKALFEGGQRFQSRFRISLK